MTSHANREIAFWWWHGQHKRFWIGHSISSEKMITGSFLYMYNNHKINVPWKCYRDRKENKVTSNENPTIIFSQFFKPIDSLLIIELQNYKREKLHWFLFLLTHITIFKFFLMPPFDKIDVPKTIILIYKVTREKQIYLNIWCKKKIKSYYFLLLIV